jgi:hypothetical protein
MARSVGLHLAMLEAVHHHALLLVAQGRSVEAALRLSFVLEHPQVAAIARTAAAASLDGMKLNDYERASAEHAARGSDIDVLLDAAARAAGKVPQTTDVAV